MKKQKIQFSIFFILSIIIFYFILKDDFNNIFNNIFNIKLGYIVLILSIILISNLFNALAFYNSLNANKINYSFKDSLKLIVVSHFFNGITPFTSGGAAYQIFKLKKSNINYSKGIGATFLNFSIFQILFFIISTISIIINKIYNIVSIDNVLKVVLLISYIINFVITVILLALLFNKNKKEIVICKILGTLNRIKILKEKSYKKLVDKINAVKSSIVTIDKSFKNIFKIILYNLLFIIFLYSLPYTIFVALGVKSLNILYIFIIYIHVMLMSIYTPMPGSVVGFEIMYLSLFGNLIENSILKTSLILWRFFNHYLLMVIGFIVFALENKKK